MTEVQKPLEAAKNAAPEKNDAMKAWEATEQFKKAQAARAAEGEKPAKDLAQDSQETSEEKAGALHLSYDAKVKAANEAAETKDAEADRGILRSSDVSDVRTNSRLLKVKKGEEKPEEQVLNLKEETARRMRAYTEETKDNWHTINYAKMGSDSKGRSHEMHVGLGDILLDPDITKISILKLDGSQKVATRGTLSNGRNCFLYADGTYAATYTGDKFRILDGSETNVKDKPAVEKYIQKIGEEDKNRITHKEYMIQNPSGSYTPGLETGKFDGTVEATGSVVDQIKAKLKPSQLEAARVIEEEFRKALAGKLAPQALSNAIAAAIINAHRESALDPNVGTGDGGKSIGLFQLYVTGGGAGLVEQYGDKWKQYAKDPHINTQQILEREVLKNRGNFLGRAAAGASAAELAGIFAYHIERPKDQAGAARRSENRTLAFFGKEKPAGDFTTPGNETMVAQGRFDLEEKKGKNVKWMAHVKSGQEQWLIGSSIGVGLYAKTNKQTTGTLATGGGDARSVLHDLKTKYWPGIEKAGITLPKQVTLVGLQLNGLRNHSQGKNPQEIAKKEFQYYLEMVAFLKSKGIPKVKISTTHVWKDIAPEILAFNELARTQSPDGYVDITPIAKSTELHNFSDYGKMARLYEQSIG